MRFSTFILDNLEPILKEWELFSDSVAQKERKEGKVLLRGHVKQMLYAIAIDLSQPQTALEKSEKSKGHSDLLPEQDSAASTHGINRWELGFSLSAAVAEFRALRASVTRLWQESHEEQLPDRLSLEDLIRFNEAIDQLINESVTSYSIEKERQSRAFDTILSSSPDLNFTCDLIGHFTYANKALTTLLKLPLEEIIGKSPRLLGMTGAEEFQQEINLVVSTTKPFRSEMTYQGLLGVPAFFDYILVPVMNDERTVEAVAGTARNVTERKAADDLNWQKANFDLLTGLPNRRLFQDRLLQELKYAKRIGVSAALLFIDLDLFKEVNDLYGHEAGDLLLTMSAERLRTCIRETDTVARLGGDEFTVILREIKDHEHVELIAEKILKELARPFAILGHHIKVSSSIGIAIFPEDASTTDEITNAADQAMYVAKKAGRNQFSFYEHDSGLLEV